MNTCCTWKVDGILLGTKKNNDKTITLQKEIEKCIVERHWYTDVKFLDEMVIYFENLFYFRVK